MAIPGSLTQIQPGAASHSKLQLHPALQSLSIMCQFVPHRLFCLVVQYSLVEVGVGEKKKKSSVTSYKKIGWGHLEYFL